MRKIPALLMVLGLASVGLVGCSVPASDDCPRPADPDPSTMSLITVDGPLDSAPDVSLRTPFKTQATAFQDVIAGTGTAVSGGEQLVVLDVTIANGADGKTVVQTPYDGDLSRVFPLSRWVQTFPAFAEALQCATEGSRVAVALAPGDIDSQTAEGLGLTDRDSAVAVIDVQKVFLTRATGALQFNDAMGMPTVVRAPDGRPGIIVPNASAPKDLVVQTLIQGDGAVVTGDEPVRLAYTGVTWDDRKVFDTTWDGEPRSIALDSVIPGFAEAITGKAVGSQILVVVPPDQGYGDAQQGGIAANSTLVFVIDILGIDQAPAP